MIVPRAGQSYANHIFLHNVRAMRFTFVAASMGLGSVNMRTQWIWSDKTHRRRDDDDDDDDVVAPRACWSINQLQHIY